VQTFELIPYPTDNIPKISITGELTRYNNLFFIHYDVDGEIEQILLPAKSSPPSRADDLWKATCFEFFIAVPNQPEYWEFNMSPSGHWNVYRIDAYRKIGFREEAAFNKLPFIFKNAPGKLSLDITVDLNQILKSPQQVQVGITAVIQTMDETESYWALAHPGEQADFHLRESFSIYI